ncbi:RNA 3'-terminal phosphate cyclase [Acinetobacter gerneri]|uniref:RNA 3'-terminal phosphate cyclase n=1 Tax=Acinetobacter gerneri DSM 14967 = CIP 107464 = MTCC 9824 TaxID=1120926 RepID=N8YBU1_9GAMM|nr:RNA 3'-terminal phosphate cyclase [Acinetobacter gerneri]ENV34076.1 RNA 3'-phosphate cyclase [Acinetobacter gerneri DSM 14967 = CIP 107464 = MTCC 9824]EPR81768.1 RNA 3'-terminal phosphate cyclase [Acinetobacter gerneri DSM 14967 = CIP 107464 = MTCC 9824]
MNTLLKKPTIQIDSSIGEGGGQILRTALALSMITGQAFELQNIRAGRKKPGLMRQHLVCVNASQQISHAETRGAELHSQNLYFAPQQIQSGRYDFHIGSAGSTTLLLQTILPALMIQNHPSTISIHGGTHNPLAPSADFIEHCFIPALNEIGIEMAIETERAGFFPIGAGQINVKIIPWKNPAFYSKLSRGKLMSLSAFAAALNIPHDIATRELEVLSNRLELTTQKQLYPQGISQGNSAFVLAEFEQHIQVFSALGEKRKSAENVAKDLAKDVKNYLNSDAIADEYLADQLLLPLALGKGGEFTAQVISEHTRTQAMLIERFLDCEIIFHENAEHCSKIQVNV